MTNKWTYQSSWDVSQSGNTADRINKTFLLCLIAQEWLGLHFNKSLYYLNWGWTCYERPTFPFCSQYSWSHILLLTALSPRSARNETKANRTRAAAAYGRVFRLGDRPTTRLQSPSTWLHQPGGAWAKGQRWALSPLLLHRVAHATKAVQKRGRTAPSLTSHTVPTGENS